MVAHEEIRENIKTSIIGEAEFIKEEKISEKVSVDSNADAELYVNLPPMSYTYYIIKKQYKYKQNGSLLKAPIYFIRKL